jgi:type I restriction enzyme R subunit
VGNINEYGRYDNLKNSVDKAKAKAYLQQRLETTLTPPRVLIEFDKLLRKFLLEGGFDVE